VAEKRTGRQEGVRFYNVLCTKWTSEDGGVGYEALKHNLTVQVTIFRFAETSAFAPHTFLLCTSIYVVVVDTTVSMSHLA
jgi:hypothetical protein